MTYNDLVGSFRANPREVSTAPINGSMPKWFYVYEQRNAVYISSGREHENACHINADRRLNPAEFPDMLGLFQRREKGEPVSQEAKARSINQSYWFGVFKELSE